MNRIDSLALTDFASYAEAGTIVLGWEEVL